MQQLTLKKVEVIPVIGFRLRSVLKGFRQDVIQDVFSVVHSPLMKDYANFGSEYVELGFNTSCLTHIVVDGVNIYDGSSKRFTIVIA